MTVRPPLWLSVEPVPGGRAQFTVALARCRNCGQVKLTSRPCGFDHLAALLEYAGAQPVITEVRVPGAVIRSEMGSSSGPRKYARIMETSTSVNVAAAVAMGDKLRGELLEAITLYGRRIDEIVGAH